MPKIFNSRYPILMACMNKGSTLELAKAVHAAGGYASLCSWTYNGRAHRMRQDVDAFVESTGTNLLHLSFELGEFSAAQVHDIVCTHSIPTIELIYGDSSTWQPRSLTSNVVNDLTQLLAPIKAQGTKVFRRIYEPVSALEFQQHKLDGFCIKGLESAGLAGTMYVADLFQQQTSLTPDALLIPYGGVGTGAQVHAYMQQGAIMVAVGTVLALTQEGPFSPTSLQAALQCESTQLTDIQHEMGGKSRRQKALKFGHYQGHDDANGTMALVRGLRGRSDGLVYLGNAVDHVTQIQSCAQVIQQLAADL